jgi:hypothetical protein
MSLFQFSDKVSKILAGFSPELTVLLQINQPLCKPGNVTLKSDMVQNFRVLAKDKMHTESFQGKLHPIP